MIVKRARLEISVEDELCARVKAMGGMAEKVQVMGRRGFVDRLVILPGPRIVFVECKRPKGGRVAPHQKWYHRAFVALGVELAIVKTSEDIDALLKMKRPERVNAPAL